MPKRSISRSRIRDSHRASQAPTTTITSAIRIRQAHSWEKADCTQPSTRCPKVGMRPQPALIRASRNQVSTTVSGLSDTDSIPCAISQSARSG